MNPVRGLSLALLIAGIVALAYGGFTYTKDSHRTQLGPIDITFKDKRTVDVPVWAGIALIVVGAGMLLVPQRSGEK